MPHRRFEIATKPLFENPDPITFELAYTRVIADPENPGQAINRAESKTFECVPYQPAGVIWDLAGVANSAATGGVLRGLIVPAQEAEFDALVHAKDVLIQWDDLLPVALWLIGEAYTGRPTVPSGPSLNGHGPTPGSSTDSLPVPASTPSG